MYTCPRPLFRATWICLALARPTALAEAQPPPTLNTLRGIVVSKADGQPLAGVPVVMAHAEKGYVRVGSGGLDAGGPELLDRRAFVSRNKRSWCDAITASDGSFALRGFDAPNEPWILAAGDRQRGYCVQPRVRPAEHADTPLRLEIDAPAFISIQRLPAPPAASFRAYVALGLVDLDGKSTTAAGPVDLSAVPEAHVRVDAWAENPEEPVWRLGPFPPGFTYRVTHTIWSPNLRYYITLFERQVFLRPGTTEAVSLESASGVTLSGRISDTKSRPLADVNVLVRMQGESAVVLGTLSDADGRYVLKHVPAGTHTLELLRHAKPTAPI